MPASFLTLHSAATDFDINFFHLPYTSVLVQALFLWGSLPIRKIFFIFFLLLHAFSSLTCIQREPIVYFLIISVMLTKGIISYSCFNILHLMKNSQYIWHSVRKLIKFKKKLFVLFIYFKHFVKEGVSPVSLSDFYRKNYQVILYFPLARITVMVG